MESIQNIVVGVYTLLQGGIGRLDQGQLDWNDVLEVGTDVMRGFIRDAGLAHNEHRTTSSEVQLVLDSAGRDYRVIVPEVPDFIPTGLEVGLTHGSLGGWGEVKLTDLDALSQYYNAPRVYGAFYGSAATPEGLKLRINMLEADAACRVWRLTYRLPLFAQLQLGNRPPLPLDFMRMVKLAWAIASVPLVKVPKERREDWRDFKRDTITQYAAELVGWNNPNNPVNPGRWQEYLNGGVGSTVQAVPRFDDHRRDEGGQMHGAVFPGGFYGYRK